jgi:transcription-repair coupling factor (superfamily II helicase)
MPVTIGYLNRFRSAKQKAETLKDLSEGKLDIIGTHQLVNKTLF